MKKNVGDADAYMRFLFGVAFLLNIIILEPSFVGLLVLLVVGLILIKTAFTRVCPLYSLLKICTCGAECQCETEEKAAE